MSCLDHIALPEINCEGGDEQDWYSSFEAQVYLKQTEAELEEELLQANLVWQWIDVICFTSCSRGKRRRHRKHPRIVILLRLKNGPERWMFWDGKDGNTRSLKWDELATEILGRELCLGLSSRGIHSDDYLRDEVRKLLR